jgi:hypothetical protein
MENSAAYAAAAKDMTEPQLREAITILLRTCTQGAEIIHIFASELSNRSKA